MQTISGCVLQCGASAERSGSPPIAIWAVIAPAEKPNTPIPSGFRRARSGHSVNI